jgi:hypothetical protein
MPTDKLNSGVTQHSNQLNYDCAGRLQLLTEHDYECHKTRCAITLAQGPRGPNLMSAIMM